MELTVHAVQFAGGVNEYLDGGSVALEQSTSASDQSDVYEGVYTPPASLTAIAATHPTYEAVFGGQSATFDVQITGHTTVDPIVGHVLIGTMQRCDVPDLPFPVRLKRSELPV
jgi:hypothetical protein